MTVDEATAILGTGPADWEWSCHAVSTALQPHVPGGKVRRGFYLGATTKPVVQHSWIELPDGQVLDPTIHAFTDHPPLSIRPADEYDIGGCKSQTPSYPPGTGGAGEVFDVDVMSVDYFADLLQLHADEWDHGATEDDPGWMAVDIRQLHWLAHAPVRDEERNGVLSRFFAPEAYDLIASAGHQALIPIDRWHWVMDEPYPGEERPKGRDA